MIRFRVLFLLCVVFHFTTVTVFAESKSVLKLRWADLKTRDTLMSGELLPADEQHPERLRLSNQANQAITWPIALIENPQITGRTYCLQGKVRYENVFESPSLGPGFLEMWSQFPGGGRNFFSRTLDLSGPMGKLSGSSPWREFQLPFDKADFPAPEKLIVNVVLPGNGVVELSDLELFDGPSSPYAAGGSGAWWSNRTSGIISGVLGTILGFVGAVVGICVGCGRGRMMVVSLLSALIPFGILGVALGIVALVLGQPYAVYYPLLLLGGISTMIGGAGLPYIRRNYQQQELRRMHALDAR